jgi:predicted  nucleic acid-binding Zn-ribbon protein
MAMNVEAEIRELKRRVSELEGSFGFLTRQVQSVHKDLLAFEAKTEEKLKDHDKRFDRIERDIRGLRDDMPKIVGDAMREVNAEKPRRKP